VDPQLSIQDLVQQKTTKAIGNRVDGTRVSVLGTLFNYGFESGRTRDGNAKSYELQVNIMPSFCLFDL